MFRNTARRCRRDVISRRGDDMSMSFFQRGLSQQLKVADHTDSIALALKDC
jgi:hypothetical protein